MMLMAKHHDVRTTLTLDDDLAAKLQAETRKTGRSFKEVVNRVIRAGLHAKVPPPTKRFRVRPRALGLRPGLDYDDVSELLEQLDGTAAR